MRTSGVALCRRMQQQFQTPRPDHIVRTANDWRAAPIFAARIREIRAENATGSVKSFKFALEPGQSEKLVYKPGQWLDVWCPGVSTIGGFTLTSAPQEHDNNEFFELAIKASEHPPAKWFASQAHVNDQVHVRVGGSFVYPPADSKGHDVLVLLAGGVGLNPILSILTWLQQNVSERQKLKQIKLLYASKEAELAFVDRLASFSDVDTTLYLSNSGTPQKDWPFKTERRRLQDIDVLGALTGHRPLAYICGPTDMTDHLEALLLRSKDQGGAGLEQNQVQLEKWW